MKHILIAGLFALTTAASASALAAPESPDRHHARHLERLSNTLELTPEQQEELRTVHQEHFEKMKALHAEKQEQVDTILTAEQRNKLQELREQRRNDMKKHQHERRHKRGGERTTTQPQE